MYGNIQIDTGKCLNRMLWKLLVVVCFFPFPKNFKGSYQTFAKVNNILKIEAIIYTPWISGY